MPLPSRGKASAINGRSAARIADAHELGAQQLLLLLLEQCPARMPAMLSGVTSSQ